MTNSSLPARLIAVIAGILLLLVLFAAAYRYMLPVLFGWVISFLLYHPSCLLHRSSRLPFSLSIFLTITGFCCFVIGIFAVAGFLFWSDFLRLVERIPELFTQLTDAFQLAIAKVLPLINFAETWLKSKGIINQHTSDTIILSLEHKAVAFMQQAGEGLFIELSLLISSLPSMIFGGMIALISTYFFIKEKSRIQSALKRVLPAAINGYKVKMSESIRFYAGSYIQAQLLLAVITAAIVLIGLLFLKIEGAPAIALIAAILDLIPIVGTSILFIPWIFYCWIQGMHSLVIGLIIIQCVNTAVRQVMEPKIIGQSLGIHPFITFLLIYVTFQWFGFKGVILSPLILLTISTLIRAGTFSALWMYIKKGTIH
ncbi:sporulation integral membrane protein YtvI [Jeotgalibacillus sp. S-D1]|uniref:sporulation integral membrane protein YtvI n=1 Tax=Jeotgalibacillus sp. S-D1 TaxID=2552189 RepID=UPI0014046FC1|nr:sporulation integral membrane protein YtvI [Jeotgalibacillus sp. S-D1]